MTWSTVLGVNEGKVRMTRLSDKESTKVSTRHRAIGRELRVEKGTYNDSQTLWIQINRTERHEQLSVFLLYEGVISD